MASGLTQQHVAPLVLSSAANFSHGLCCTPVSVLLAVPPPSLSLILLPDSTFGVFQRVLEPLFFFCLTLFFKLLPVVVQILPLCKRFPEYLQSRFLQIS